MSAKVLKTEPLVRPSSTRGSTSTSKNTVHSLIHMLRIRIAGERGALDEAGRDAHPHCGHQGARSQARRPRRRMRVDRHAARQPGRQPAFGDRTGSGRHPAKPATDGHHCYLLACRKRPFAHCLPPDRHSPAKRCYHPHIRKRSAHRCCPLAASTTWQLMRTRLPAFRRLPSIT